MTLVPIRPPQMVFEKRRGEIERGRQIVGDVYRVSYFIDMIGSGEAIVDVNFPVAFSEYPGVSHGGALHENSPLVRSNYPFVSVVVARWVTVERNTKSYYTGATLALVATGPLDTRYIMHFHVEGKALANPI